MTTFVKLVDSEGKGCGHLAEADFSAGDRRVECHCGDVYVVRATVPCDVQYEVRRLPRSEGVEPWPSPSE